MTITRTLDWILSKAPDIKLNILDLGCGPGLYCAELAGKGHKVTGVDFSEESINFAKEYSDKNDLNVKYINSNYLKLDPRAGEFDLIIMIFTDFGVLTPEERSFLLMKIRKSLKPEGLFIFDVLNDKDWTEKTTPASWECADKGFWSPGPYLVLSSSHIYQEEKVILYQHLVLDESETMRKYHFWTGYFANADLRKLLSEHGFGNCSFHRDVLPGENQWSGENVTFTVAGS